MQIKLDGVGKKFNRKWIFKELSYDFSLGKSYAILGNNGSGKTTLIKCIAGAAPVTKGNVVYRGANHNVLSVDTIYKEISWVGPYVDFPEELYIEELFSLYDKFKCLEVSYGQFLEELSFSSYNSKIKFLSSGMKQKLKLALAFFSKPSIIFLDEPTSNLDKKNILWYENLFKSRLSNKLVILGSNTPSEYELCSGFINIDSFKKPKAL